MPKVICNVRTCKFNLDQACTKETIEINSSVESNGYCGGYVESNESRDASFDVIELENNALLVVQKYIVDSICSDRYYILDSLKEKYPNMKTVYFDLTVHQGLKNHLRFLVIYDNDSIVMTPVTEEVYDYLKSYSCRYFASLGLDRLLTCSTLTQTQCKMITKGIVL